VSTHRRVRCVGSEADDLDGDAGRLAEPRREYQRMRDLWEEAKEIKEAKTAVDAAETTKEVGEAASDL